MQSLYKISEQYQSLLALDDPDIPDEAIEDTLESISGEFDDKAIQVMKFALSLSAEAQAIKDAELLMAKRRKMLTSKHDYLKNYVLINMQRLDKTKLSCEYFQLRVAKSPASVLIEDEGLIPVEFLIEKSTIAVDKKGIKDAGGCPGATIHYGYNLRVS